VDEHEGFWGEGDDGLCALAVARRGSHRTQADQPPFLPGPAIRSYGSRAFIGPGRNGAGCERGHSLP